MTSAEAAKLLRKLNDEQASLLAREENCRQFLASVGEDVEACRPAYDYAETQAMLQDLEDQIRTLKHALNVFNVTTVVPGFDMTIDEMLVYIPQLTRAKAKLNTMKQVLPKTREMSYGSQIIDYRYANYDIAAVEADYDKITDELSRAQTALDKVNSIETFQVEL